MMKHIKVPFHYKYSFINKRCEPLTPDSTTEEKLHQYIGVWIDEEEEEK